MKTCRSFLKNLKRHLMVSLIVFSMLINACEHQTDDKEVLLTAAGKPVEGTLDSFLGEAKMDAQKLFEGNRFPNVLVGVDGTVLAFWGQQMRPHVRRSDDGGATWTPEFPIGDDPEYKGRGLGAGVVDETTGDIIIFMYGSGEDRSVGRTWRSRNNGKTWMHNGNQEDIIKPNTPVVINGRLSASERAFTHGNDNGITLRHGKSKGRLLIGARNWYPEEERQRDKYNCAIYSDDGGKTWQTSAPFPVFGTGEGAVEELSNGHIYHSARRNYFTEGEFRHERLFAWSYDGGETWQNPALSNELPDGPRYRGEDRRGANYNGHFGMMGGLVRLPVKGRDILLYSNADTDSHIREHGTVWASFDGGKSWPVKRLVHKGPFAYSSLAAGRPETESEGWIYMQHEGGLEHHYEAGYMARFNLAWVLNGELTGDGKIPEWVK